jgi:Flp pilus assembly protein TadD
LKRTLPLALACGALLATAAARDLRITLPKRTKPTPVQNLNREGVKAVEKHDYDKAKRLFYKAYLLDPDDPFTLNNLGYIAELEGDVERAQRYYELSKQMESDALVDRSTSEEVLGKSVAEVAGNAATNNLQVNRLNVAAIGLLQKDRAPEADVLLTRALQIDPNNPFTLNNLGFAKEKEGELENALSYYTRAANTNSEEAVVVTVHSSWRGKPIREIARRNADNVRDLLSRPDNVEDRVARLNLQGVSAINRNDRRSARTFFQQAYELMKDDAFTLNNMGYLAEMDGDRETADYFYGKAQEAERAGDKVGMATRKDAEGKPLLQVAATSNESVNARMQRDLEIKRRQGGPVQLKRRSGEPVVEPAQPKRPTPREQSDVVSIPVPKSDAFTPENVAPGNVEPATPTTEQPQAQPQAQPQITVQPEEPQLVKPEELEQPPNPQSSSEPPK